MMKDFSHGVWTIVFTDHRRKNMFETPENTHLI